MEANAGQEKWSSRSLWLGSSVIASSPTGVKRGRLVFREGLLAMSTDVFSCHNLVGKGQHAAQHSTVPGSAPHKDVASAKCQYH